VRAIIPGSVLEVATLRILYREDLNMSIPNRVYDRFTMPEMPRFLWHFCQGSFLNMTTIPRT
jgi:hypothetical protein